MPMPTITDPARELADIAGRFSTGTSLKGEQVISNHGFAPWSSEFYRLIVTIHERADLVIKTLPRTAIDRDLISDAIESLTEYKRAFTPKVLQLACSNAESSASILKDNGKNLQYLSPVIREFEHYPKYDQQEVDDLIQDIEEYLEGLSNSDDYLFIKESIKEGLNALMFRLRNIGWFGGGYALSSLHSAMELYRSVSNNNDIMGNPDAEMFVRGFGNIIKKMFSNLKDMKDAVEIANIGYKGYALGSSLYTTYALSHSLLLAGPK